MTIQNIDGGIMTIQELNNYIFHYLEKDKTQTAIMLSGEWGSGKTYYIEHELVPFLKRKNATCIVVSLYGLEDVTAISKSIYMELRMPTLGGKSSETVTTGKVIAKNVIKNITGIAGISLRLSDEDLSELYESVNLKDKLLILEDIERSNISVTKLLGYVNGLVERDGVKVLLVANENEILQKQPQNESSEVQDEVKKYRHIKEKTISDTIQFTGDVRSAIREILKEFDCEYFSRIIDTEVEEKLLNMVCSTCNKNLRTFIFAIQKMVDIVERMNGLDFEDDFYHCLLFGIIYLSAHLKEGEFPKWEGNGYLSTKLGSNEMPLMRFAYEYIRWQTFELEAAKQTYQAYKEFKFFDKHAEYNDSDLRILRNYAEETEENIFNALENIERKLQIPDAIGIHAYCKLAYYMIYVGSVVGFDYRKSCELMIKNAKGIGQNANMDADIYFAHTYSIENVEIKAKYEGFIKELSEAIVLDQEKNNLFSNPDDLVSVYADICQNTCNYTKGHRFISKYNQQEIVDMLLLCSAAQLQNFRGILFAVYRHASKNEFDEKDVEAMNLLLQLVEEKRSGEHHWDKIQLMQVNWLCLNLNQFIQQMS